MPGRLRRTVSILNLGDLEYDEYETNEKILQIRRRHLAQHLAKFVCEATNVRRSTSSGSEGRVQVDAQSANSVELLVEAEIGGEFLEKIFRREE